MKRRTFLPPVPLPILRFILLRHRVSLVLCVLCPLAIGFLASAFFESVRPDLTLREYMNQVPEYVRKLMSSRPVKVLEMPYFLTIPFRHPISLAIFAILPMSLSSALLAGEIGARTMDLLLSQPLRRGSLVLAGVLVTVGASLLLAAAPLLGLLLGDAVTELTGRPPYARYALCAFEAFLFILCLSGVFWFFAAVSRDRGQALLLGIVFVLVAFFAEYAGRIWEAVAFLRLLSPFGYFDPIPIVMDGSLPAASFVVLPGVGLLGFALSFVVFGRRDIL